jgi:hypothetical protein
MRHSHRLKKAAHKPINRFRFSNLPAPQIPKFHFACLTPSPPLPTIPTRRGNRAAPPLNHPNSSPPAPPHSTPRQPKIFPSSRARPPPPRPCRLSKPPGPKTSKRLMPQKGTAWRRLAARMRHSHHPIKASQNSVNRFRLSNLPAQQAAKSHFACLTPPPPARRPRQPSPPAPRPPPSPPPTLKASTKPPPTRTIQCPLPAQMRHSLRTQISSPNIPN